MLTKDRIYVAGHEGLVGSAIMRALKRNGFDNLITRTKEEIDLRDADKTARLFAEEKPDYAFISAARVGGVLANSTYPAEFIHENLQIIINTIHQAYVSGVKKLVFLGSACIYPKECPLPIKEEYFMTGLLEETVKPYSISKIAGITMCQSYNRQYGTNFISAVPTNLYGINDNYDPLNSHVLPALLDKFLIAKNEGKPTVTVWGTGKARRELMFSDDLADSLILLMNEYDSNEIINIGTGEDISINELAELIKEVVGYKGKIVYDRSKPDGTPRRHMEVTRLRALGFHHQTDLREGIEIVMKHHIQEEEKRLRVPID